MHRSLLIVQNSSIMPTKKPPKAAHRKTCITLAVTNHLEAVDKFDCGLLGLPGGGMTTDAAPAAPEEEDDKDGFPRGADGGGGGLRASCSGFGAGNFKSLFEAIEREQVSGRM